MILKRNGSQASMAGPAEWFTGTARIDPIQLQPEEPSRVTAALVTFEPGARTNWHTQGR
jgi:quercetin dioxygenase-like cupin family protein